MRCSFSSPTAHWLPCTRVTATSCESGSGPEPVTLLVGPEANRLLMTSGADEVQAGPIWTRILPFYRGAVLATDGPPHRDQRRLLQDVSSLERIREYVPVMARTTRERVERWGARTDLYAEMEHIALANTTRTLLGIELPESQHREFFGWHRAISGMILGIPGNELPLSRRWRGARAQRAMWRLLAQVVSERRGHEGADALSHLVASPGVSDRDVLVHAFTLLAAGHATMAGLMYFALAAALARPELLARTRRTLPAIRGPPRAAPRDRR
jgi:epi-isozizaene 5-monooxygenase / beta-farnesene synthase